MSDKKNSIYFQYLYNMKSHYRRRHKIFEKLGLYPGQPALLLSLHNKNGQSQKELAEKMLVKPSTLTVVLSRLEKTDLVTKKVDENDKRISRVYLTDKGSELCKEIRELENQLQEECFQHFTDEEKIIFRRLLMQMSDNLIKKMDSEENN